MKIGDMKLKEASFVKRQANNISLTTMEFYEYLDKDEYTINLLKGVAEDIKGHAEEIISHVEQIEREATEEF